MSSIGSFVGSYKGAVTLATAVGGKFAHFVTSREADRQGKRVKISDQAANTWFSTPPPEELVEIYVREEIAKVLRADGVTLEDGECCPPWTKAAWAKSPQAAVPAETSEDDKTPARRKLIKRVLPVAVASTALGVAAFK